MLRSIRTKSVCAADTMAGRGSAILWVALAAVLVVGLAYVPADAADWKGEETVKEGVPYVMNPADPMEEPKAAALEELWRLGGDTDDEDQFFGVITAILTDNAGNVFLLDTQLAQVKIFSPSGEFVRDIGREGEGPGEFRFPAGMFFTDDGNVAVVQVQPGKIVLLTPEGEPAGEHPIPKAPEGGFLQLVGAQTGGKNLVVAAAQNAFGEGKFEQTRYLASINSDGEEITRYHGDTRKIDFANAIMKDSDWDTFDRRWVVGTDGRLYAATKYLDYRIHVWNPDGEIDRVIERTYTHRKRSTDELEVVENMMSIFARQIPNCTVEIEENTKDIESIFVREDGSLWVLTSDGSRDHPEGTLGLFDVYDSKGRFVREVTLKGEGDPLTDGYYFVNDRLYVVTDLLQALIGMQSGGESFQVGEEEPEPMAVICYELPSDLMLSSR